MAIVCRCSYFHSSSAISTAPANTGHNGIVADTYFPTTIPAIRQMAILTKGVFSNTMFLISFRFNVAKIVKKGKSEK